MISAGFPGSITTAVIWHIGCRAPTLDQPPERRPLGNPCISARNSRSSLPAWIDCRQRVCLERGSNRSITAATIALAACGITMPGKGPHKVYISGTANAFNDSALRQCSRSTSPNPSNAAFITGLNPGSIRAGPYPCARFQASISRSSAANSSGDAASFKVVSPSQ